MFNSEPISLYFVIGVQWLQKRSLDYTIVPCRGVLGRERPYGAMEIRKRSAGIVVVRKAAQGWLYLILRAYRNWDFPKGEIDAAEDPLRTAIRETKEETSIDDLEFKWGTEFIETQVYAGGKVARFYLAETARSELTLPVSPELGRPEHHEYRWAAYEEARSLLPPRLIPVLDWARSRVEAVIR